MGSLNIKAIVDKAKEEQQRNKIVKETGFVSVKTELPQEPYHLGNSINHIVSNNKSKLTAVELRLLEALLQIKDCKQPKVDVVYEAANGNPKNAYVLLNRIAINNKKQFYIYAMNPNTKGKHNIVLTRVVQINDKASGNEIYRR